MPKQEKEHGYQKAGRDVNIFGLLHQSGLDVNQMSDLPGEKLRFWSVNLRKNQENEWGRGVSFAPVFRPDQLNLSLKEDGVSAKQFSEDGRIPIEQATQSALMVVFTKTEGKRPTNPILVCCPPGQNTCQAVKVDIRSKSFGDKVKEWFRDIFSKKEDKEKRAQENQEKREENRRLGYLLDNIQANVNIIHGRLGNNLLQETDAERISAATDDIKEMGDFVHTMSQIKNAPVAENHPQRIAAGLTLAYLHKDPKQFSNKETLQNLANGLVNLPCVQKMAKSLSSDEFLSRLANPELQQKMMDVVIKDIQNNQIASQKAPPKLAKNTEAAKEKPNQNSNEQALTIAAKGKPAQKSNEQALTIAAKAKPAQKSNEQALTIAAKAKPNQKSNEQALAVVQKKSSGKGMG